MNRKLLSVVALLLVAVVGCSARAADTPEPTTSFASVPSPTPAPEESTAQAETPSDSPTPTAVAASSTPEPDLPQPAASDEESESVETTATMAHPLIVSFTVDPEEIDPGDEVRLTWETSADAVTLCSTERGGPLSECANLPGSGTWDIVTDELDREYEEYILFAEAGEVSDQQSVTVTIRCPTLWFFEDAPEGCPYAAVHSQGAIQHFEQGTMIWVGGLDTIFVLYDDDQHSPRWDRFADTWDSSMVESDPELVPPAGLLQPVRGFGLVWRGPEGAAILVRERLGWATGPESALDTVYQCDSAPKYNTCYLQVEQDVLVLEPERSGWHIYTASN